MKKNYIFKKENLLRKNVRKRLMHYNFEVKLPKKLKS